MKRSSKPSRWRGTTSGKKTTADGLRRRSEGAGVIARKVVEVAGLAPKYLFNIAADRLGFAGNVILLQVDESIGVELRHSAGERAGAQGVHRNVNVVHLLACRARDLPGDLRIGQRFRPGELVNFFVVPWFRERLRRHCGDVANIYHAGARVPPRTVERALAADALAGV